MSTDNYLKNNNERYLKMTSYTQYMKEHILNYSSLPWKERITQEINLLGRVELEMAVMQSLNISELKEEYLKGNTSFNNKPYSLKIWEMLAGIDVDWSNYDNSSEKTNKLNHSVLTPLCLSKGITHRTTSQSVSLLKGVARELIEKSLK